jgi:hypothetical protein
MNSLMLYLCMFSAVPVAQVLPLDDLQALGLGSETVSGIRDGLHQTGRFIRSTDRLLLTINAKAHQSDSGETFTFKPGEMVPNTMPETLGTPSALPLGTESRYHLSATTLQFWAKTPWEQVTMSARAPGGPPADIKSLGEAVARYSLAALAARRMTVPVRTTKSGLTARYATDQKTGTEMVALRDWAQAKGWSYAFSTSTAVATLSKSGRTLTVPAGSMKVRSAQTWHNLPDIVRKVEQDLYVPLAALEAASK